MATEQLAGQTGATTPSDQKATPVGQGKVSGANDKPQRMVSTGVRS